MAKIRSLKPDFFSSEQIVSVSIPARYLFEGIWVFGDDEGLIKNSPMSLKMKIFPGDVIEVKPLIEELVRAGLLVELQSDQGPLLWAPNVQVHQLPKRITATKFTGLGSEFTPRNHAGIRGNVPPMRGASGEHEPPTEATRREHEAQEWSGEERNRSGEERRGASSEVATATTRPDVEGLLDLLDSELSKNDVKRLPSRNKANRDAIRLMIDKDGISPDQIAAAIRWCQADSFWWKNIMSAVKLREKFERLRADSRDQSRARQGGQVLTPNQERGLAIVQELREEENRHAEITDG